MQNAFLFVYGTLLDDGNEFAIYLKNNSSFYAEGRIKGKLYDLGEYPGAVRSENDDKYIYGSILQLDDPEKILLVIDDYEGYNEKQVEPNLFIRVLVEAWTENGPATCWMYEYNLSVEGLEPIETGRYLK